MLTDPQRRLLALLASRESVTPEELESTLSTSYDELEPAFRPLAEEGLVMVCVPLGWSRGWLEITPRGRALVRAGTDIA